MSVETCRQEVKGLSCSRRDLVASLVNDLENCWSDDPDVAGHSREMVGGRDRDRTGDPLLAKQVLSQLSYTPTVTA